MKNFLYLLLLSVLFTACTVNETESQENAVLPADEQTLENTLQEGQENRFLNESMYQKNMARLEKHGLTTEESITFLRDCYHDVMARSQQSRDAIFGLYNTHKNAPKDVIIQKVDSINQHYGFDEMITDQKMAINLMSHEIDKMIIARFGE